jgi:hypothetical protein
MLGEPRETGVVLDLVRSMSNAGDMAEGICLEYLVERIDTKLRKQRNRLIRSLNAIDPLRVHSQTRFLLAGMDPNAAGSESTAEQSQKSDYHRSLEKPYQPALFQMHESSRDRAQRIIKELAAPILSFQPRYQFSQATDEKLHELRISFRSTRWNFFSLWPHGLKEKIENIRS